MPKGRVPARVCICKACGQRFVTDKVGKAAQLCHRTECDEQRERQRRAERDAEKALRARQRQAEVEERQRQRRAQRIREREEREARRRAEREEQERQRKAERIAAARRRALEKKARKKGLEIFAPIMDSPDSMLLIEEILEIAQLASELREPSWVDLRKAITRLASARPDGREAAHEALKHLSAVAMRMADLSRTHATRDPNPAEELEEEPDRELVAA